MNAIHEPGRGDVWDQIDRDKRTDRLIRRVIVIAWSVVLLMLLIYAILVLLDVTRSWELAEMGAMASTDAILTVMPLVYAVGAISLVLATLSTIGAFLRSRTATLSEIQLRLAGLESILRAQADSVAMRADGDSRGIKSS
jgi:hypothetical protein